MNAACSGGSRPSGACLEPLLERGQVCAAIVVFGEDTGEAHERLHAGEAVLETLDVLGARRSQLVVVSHRGQCSSCSRERGGTHPFGGCRFFSTWVNMHSVL